MALEDIVTVKTDDEGDLVVEEDSYGNKSFTLIDGEKAISQNLQARILSTMGERILHPDYGFDFPAVETVFDENLVRGEMARAILDDPDVEEIPDLALTFEGRTRNANYEGVVRVKDGDLIGIFGQT